MVKGCEFERRGYQSCSRSLLKAHFIKDNGGTVGEQPLARGNTAKRRLLPTEPGVTLHPTRRYARVARQLKDIAIHGPLLNLHSDPLLALVV